MVTPSFVAARDREAVTDVLRAQLAGLPGRSPFYAGLFAEHGVTPAAFETLDDLCRLPFTTKPMLRESQAQAPPSGSTRPRRAWSPRPSSASRSCPSTRAPG